MKKLIRKISESTGRQLFIATHNDLISSRLDLRKSILLNSNSSAPVLLKNIPDETARFFMKAPDNNVLQFILSKKVVLVEGDAEYILMGLFFEKPDEFDVHIISVGGTSFKRYLDIAKVLGIKTAVIRDNDKNYESNCADNYSDYTCDFIQVFSDTDNNRCTFEVALYQDNTELCDKLFKSGRKTLTVQDYMLKNKADAAFALLEAPDEVKPPSYILEAIEWIKK
jgi:predicted ATP-dependent endonuclease of OLD family